ncbi:His-Xaa-Ser system radical SAM maturase HxsB [Pseudenhygromyxa sp. WMMC2535]|uniref:His-Xaa-Ser system radical SAM maturase HxsB n=1 Tax=Pseudenhygromyxa sp. WMMC2535 TaxID=2712867 RepID=UPI001552B3EE|nr:His-Xaa-Ser system radical SAM maturase HxsB [Pseudenhygromyxa sp. WMMC2535]NVB36981.1 His-Xaa-Ser system radical SAM maturase HxsB [Pseudenhygromyxa sp. WMMC2535]
MQPINLAQIQPRPGTQAFFRWRQIADDAVLITNYEGNFLILTGEEFASYARGDIAPDSELHARLSEHNFLRASYDVQAATERVKARRYFVHGGPLLHVMVVTLRCNETCVYCHASRANMDAVETDMSVETARKAVDLALSSTNGFVTIEFQGGEPLVNFPVVKEIIEYATKRNQEVGKRLEFTMVSNFALLDEDKLQYLLANKVQLCTSIDGPEQLHNAQRKLPQSHNAFQAAARWIKRVNEAYEEIGLDPTLYHVEALLTTTKATLDQWKEVVDTYVSLGCKTIFLRPIDPFGFAERARLRLEYPRSAYLEFYRNAVDYMIELNKQGVEILERYAAIFLTKILRGEDPNFLDNRSPAGAGIGQLAYSYDGKVYTCDEGRMLAAMGDDVSLLGDVDTPYRKIVGHETVRAMTIATNLDQQPDCVSCAYQPYCGTNAAYNYKSQGSVFGRMRDNNVCAVHKGIQDYLFEKLAENDPQVMEIFQRWTTIRPREHFVQEPPVGIES